MYQPPMHLIDIANCSYKSKGLRLLKNSQFWLDYSHAERLSSDPICNLAIGLD